MNLGVSVSFREKAARCIQAAYENVPRVRSKCLTTDVHAVSAKGS
jgi:hypothetical protein